MAINRKKVSKLLKANWFTLFIILLGVVSLIALFFPQLFVGSGNEAGQEVVGIFSARQNRNSRSYIGDNRTYKYYQNTSTKRSEIPRENQVFFDNEAQAEEYAFSPGY